MSKYEHDNRRNDQSTQTAYEKVIEHFHGDKSQANEWFSQPHRKLDGKSPLNMIGNMRADQLNNYVDAALRGKK
jgi:uncharacterized protein (DUF2384 family)